ncbi:MAG: FKBP-type peptidyl-prolyl cis-trans isomerase [Ignavibacteriales bacterium]|nr:FKBP-type peptidyl-prolyl cis-trans isomerase [Ignavibacteriales bacterium]
MKFLKIFTVLLFTVSVSYAQTETKPFALKTLEDSVSYSVGCTVGTNIKDPGMKISFDALVQGLKDAFDGKTVLTEEQMQNMLSELNKKMMEKRTTEMNTMKEKNKKEGDTFLAANKTEEGVVTMPSGLQCKVLTKGAGAQPKKEDKVKVHYKGTLLDGREFDSSYKRNEPAEFGVTQVIKGWTEALQLMHVGDKWMLYIPSDLAYGDRGAGEMIQPGSTLVFEVELLEIVKQEAEKK